MILHGVLLRRRAARLAREGGDEAQRRAAIQAPEEEAQADWRILVGGLAFVAFSSTMGLSRLPGKEEIVFAGSLAIVGYLIFRLTRTMDQADARALVGTALIVFVFRAVPLPGPGHTWFRIDVLGFDEQFLSVLTLVTSALTLAGLLVLRPFMAHRPIWFVIVVLSIAAGILSLPDIGLYYGLHEWTALLTGGVVDARFIAVLDTAAESPLGQVAMVPLLAWIARNAPAHLKATFFAVTASFTNLALSASQLATKYVNELFVVTRQVLDPQTGAGMVPRDYSELGVLLIVVAALGTTVPLLTVWVVQRSRFRTGD